MNEQIKRLKTQLQTLSEGMDAIVTTADARDGQMTEEEATRFNQLQADFNRTADEIARREQAEASRLFMQTSTGRRAEAEPLAPSTPNNQAPNSPPRPSGLPSTVPAAPRDGRCGFLSFGQFLGEVRDAGRNSGSGSAYLRALGPGGSYGNESSGPDGGYAIPPDFRADIISRMYDDESLLPMTDRLTTSSNQMVVPLDEANPWDAGGITALWRGEAGGMTGTKPNLKDRTFKMFSLHCLVPVTDELLEDAPSMEAYIRRKAPDALKYKMNEAILFGTGVGQPTGVTNTPACVRVEKEAGQGTDTIVFANLSKMWSRMYGGCRKTASWFYNQDIEPQLMAMFLNIVKTDGTTVNGFPVWLPPGGASSTPYATLFGRPMIPLENCPSVGSPGDITFADLKKYATLTKAGNQFVKQDTSLHVYFDVGMTAFRFIVRLGGESWWTKPFSRAKSNTTLGCAVTLEERA